ncbi:MAG: AAA family ATPase [Halothiobacillaceae bacterium]
MTVLDNRSTRSIARGLASRYPLFYLVTADEQQVAQLMPSIARSWLGEGGAVHHWSVMQGLDCDPDATREPLAVIEWILDRAGNGDPAVYLLQDLPAWLEGNPILQRALRELYQRLQGTRNVVFMTYPKLSLPEVVGKEVFVVELEPPDEVEILANLQRHPQGAGLDESVRARLAARLRGLSLDEINHLAARLFRGGHVPEEAELMREIQEEKAQVLKKERCLQFYPSSVSLEDIGGLENLKHWVTQRRMLFSEQAYRDRVPLPAGILFMGVSGCGKSMAAKAVAAAWSLPLVRLDMSLVLSGTFGTPEYAFERATRIAGQIAPVVLWIDELENAFGYDAMGGAGGRTTIFSSFLTWLQEKSPKVFVAATANRIQQLPAELMRKGRFDQLFFLDLPTDEERREILAIHIRRHGGEPGQFDLGYLAASTQGWSGAEIEQVVKSARMDAYAAGRAFTERDIVHNAVDTVPLSRTMVEQIKEIRNWCFKRAVNASGPARDRPGGQA